MWTFIVVIILVTYINYYCIYFTAVIQYLQYCLRKIVVS
jgi:hypothetical protein